MSSGTTNKGAVADAFETRAATFRRIAGEMKDPEDRAELLRIAAAYEEDAARLREDKITRSSEHRPSSLR